MKRSERGKVSYLKSAGGEFDANSGFGLQTELVTSKSGE